MKWADAIKASTVQMAFRYLRTDDQSEPNVVLMDRHGPGEKPKAFRADGSFAWERRPLKEAKKFVDWRPAPTRVSIPLVPPDVVTQLGDVVADESERSG